MESENATVTTPNHTDVRHLLGRVGILPIVRTSDADIAFDQVERLHNAGAQMIELTTTIPGWAELLRSVIGENPELMLGVGTVTEPSDARRALAAGASFLVSPYPVPAVREIAEQAGILFLEGALSPGELATVGRCGVAKLFPAHVGGVAYLRSVSQVLPRCLIVPSGGIRLDEVDAWLDAGALAVGIGRELFTMDNLAEFLSAAGRRATERAA